MTDPAEIAAKWGVEKGYHDVFGHWRDASHEALTRLTAALSAGRQAPAPWPDNIHVNRAYQGSGKRTWGLAVQLYALRSRRNWGHGDFSDLKALIAIAADAGAGSVGLNPLHALFIDRPEDASPYSPNSRLFINPLYIDVEAIPEFPGLGASALAKDVAALRDTEMVDYTRAARVKLIGLRLAYDAFHAGKRVDRHADFEAYRKEQGEALLRFACFECLRRRFGGKPWWDWPQEWRAPNRAELEALRRSDAIECGFHEFTQWIADRQLRDCQAFARERGMPVGLYIDLAVGVDPGGADAWIQQDAVLKDVSVGAPPDEFNPAGQDWGLTTYNPQALIAKDYEPFRVLLRSAMRHAGAIRLDHVLGLMRIYTIPRGMGGQNGAYVRFPFEALLSVIAEESHANHCVVIGEDLGTVPDGFRDTLLRWGLWSYRVVMFEREHGGGFRAPQTYPAEALATFNTHDLSTFRGWMENHDLTVKRGMGIDPGETDEARANSRDALKQTLSQFGGGQASDSIEAVAAFLAATPSLLVCVGIEDVLGMKDQVNIPGTVREHPNWRRRLPVAIEDLAGDGRLKKIGDVFAQAGRGRAS